MTGSANKETAAIAGDRSKSQIGSGVNVNATCFNCRGMGHLSTICPSPKGIAARCAKEQGRGNQGYHQRPRGGQQGWQGSYKPQAPAGRYFNRGGFVPWFASRGGGRGNFRRGGRPMYLADNEGYEQGYEQYLKGKEETYYEGEGS
jgi:hypothetical protein